MFDDKIKVPSQMYIFHLFYCTNNLKPENNFSYFFIKNVITVSDDTVNERSNLILSFVPRWVKYIKYALITTTKQPPFMALLSFFVAVTNA